MNQQKLIELAQKRTGADSQAELSRAAGIDKARLTRLRTGERPMSNDEARRLAELAGLPWAEVIAELEIERASDEATRTAWGKALATMRAKGLALVVALVCVVAVTLAPVQTPGRVFSRRRLSIIFIM